MIFLYFLVENFLKTKIKNRVSADKRHQTRYQRKGHAPITQCHVLRRDEKR